MKHLGFHALLSLPDLLQLPGDFGLSVFQTVYPFNMECMKPWKGRPTDGILTYDHVHQAEACVRHIFSYCCHDRTHICHVHATEYIHMHMYTCVYASVYVNVNAYVYICTYELMYIPFISVKAPPSSGEPG